jgi:uncharacterized membrane protein (UPF0127 family)
MNWSTSPKSVRRQKYISVRNSSIHSEKTPPLLPVFLLALFLCPACFAGNSAGRIRFESRELGITRRDGVVVPITVELAQNDAQREQGLMFRKELAAGRGMLFIFDRDQIMSFWMKDTLIPLSIAFISRSGRITEITHMQPGSTRIVYSREEARYALEVPQGWFREAGVGVGDRLDPGGL